MIKYFLLYVMSGLLPLVLIAQPATFGKILNLEGSYQGVGSYVLLDNETVHIYSGHFCKNGTETIDCIGISQIDFNGNLLNTAYITNQNFLFGSIGLLEKDTLLLLTRDDISSLNNITIADFELNTNTFQTEKLSIDNNKRYLPEGIQKLNNSYIVHGHYDDLTPGVRIKGFVKRFNQNFSEEISSWTFGENEFLNVNDLRITSNEGMVFSFYEENVGPGGPEHPVKIIMIDTIGQIIKEYKLENGSAAVNTRINIELDNQDDLYFNYDAAFFHKITKLNAKLDSVIWDIRLPTDYYPLDLGYTVSELMIAQNGDLVVTGSVDYIHEEITRVNSTFVTRIDSANGNIKWLKIFTHEITEPNLFGLSYADSYIHDVIELPNGNLLGVGQLTQATIELNGILQEIFLYSISADGCIEGFDCNKDVYVLNAGESVDIFTNTQDLLPLDEISIYPNPVQDKLYLEATEQNWHYQILNLQGQLILQGQYENNIEVAQLPSGIYFLQLSREDEMYKAIKFVKE